MQSEFFFNWCLDADVQQQMQRGLRLGFDIASICFVKSKGLAAGLAAGSVIQIP